ncbi:MAG: DUF3570 domain-containing protein [Aquabacterium sp.]
MRIPALIVFAAGASLCTQALAENTISYQAYKYVESNGRMKVQSGDLSIEKDFGTDYTLHLDAGYDGISGATPCWKTKPGFANEYVSGLCKVENDVRNSLNAAFSWRDTSRNEYTVGAAVSHESDFVSNQVSAQAQFWHDDSHNRSYTIGADIQSNTSIATGFTNNAEDRHLSGLNMQAGVNQVLDRTSTLEGSLYLGRESGYLSNQYLKIVRQDDFGQKSLADDDRPERRHGGGFAVRWIKSWRDELKTNLWYRHYGDNWGVTSETVEAKVYWDLNDQWRLNPVVRLFSQTSADFYRAYGDQVNTFATTGYGSNDARLGSIKATTTQFNVEYHASKEWSLNTGFSHYRQDTGLTANWLSAGFVFKY